ncbi:MAG TPA: class I SAM-dependent methyltransferase [Thermoanaerobaculia bacterium]|nr:class I SAM-dependent methyltransferase [Thermoanaerobaculia bacterium]
MRERGVAQRAKHRCRSCGAALDFVVVDLGAQPLANSYLSAEDLERPEVHYPLCVRLCTSCFLVQVPAVVPADAIFSDYAYFSSYSVSWLDAARRYVEMAAARFALGPQSLVVEVASNDGYLLRWFRDRGVPVLGIEPARNVAAHAEAAGIPTLVRFLGAEVGQAVVDGAVQPTTPAVAGRVGRAADLVVANNVLAHVPDLADFTAGLRALLAPRGVLTIEVPHLLRLLEEVQFDTIYHEHFSYYSLHAASRALAARGLVVFDVEELPTHGGSLRLFCRRADAPADPRLEDTERVGALLEQERRAGLLDFETYWQFGERVRGVKLSLLRFLVDARGRGETVVGYGAPAKGNTLLNYCGVGPDLIELTVDLSPHKQGKFLPGSRIPVFAPERIAERRPEWVLVLPWNLEDEIVRQMAAVREWGGRFVVPIPEVREV